MILLVLLVAVHFISLHTPEGEEVTMNVGEISSIRQPREAEGHVADGVRCLLIMTNGKLNGVTETCREVIKLIAAVETDS